MRHWLTMIVCLMIPAGAMAQAPEGAATPPDSVVIAPPVAAPAPLPGSPTISGYGTPGGSASISNPAISVIGWFQGASGNDLSTQEGAFEFREAELGFQAAVDPFTRADFFIAAAAEGLEVEEGTITWLALPGGGQLKAGKFRADLGKFNRTHPPETPFADRPLATVAFLGEEGLATTGIAASVLVPNPAEIYWDVTANLGTVPEAGEAPVLAPGARGDLLALGRTSAFVPLGESADVNLGLSYANAPADPALFAEGTRAQLGCADLTLRWKNPRRSIYRSLLVQAEVLAEQGSARAESRRTGAFACAIWQFARQWKVGARWDWTASPFAPGHAAAALALLSWQPSEYSVLSLQARRVRNLDGRDLDAGFLKWTFNIGPHGAHPY